MTSADATARRWKTPAAVAVGGALGAGGRWLVGVPLDTQAEFPWHTLVVNLVGCLLIGIAAGRLARDTLAWSFVVGGLLGGFTTMSALAWELNDLADAGRNGLVAAYLVASMAGGWVALLIGERVAPRRVEA